MQDSLEDYIRISKNCKNNPDKFVRKDILFTAQRKQECDNRAKQIVEFSIEGKLLPEVFIKCLPFIDQTHYQDIVEERAISKLCGYAICGKLIPEMPKKQFHISTRNNKVYDITDRKNYCSNFCYTASVHLKKQVDTSPLWLRKIDDTKQFNLLAKTQKSCPGIEVIARVTVEDDKEFTSISAFAHLSLQDMENKEVKSNRNEENIATNNQSNKQPHMETINEEISEIDKEETLEVVKVDKKINDKKRINKKRKKKQNTTRTDIEKQIKQSLREWLTLETIIYIYGEEKVKLILNENKLIKYFEKLKIIELATIKQQKYIEICRKLQLKELADEQFDNAILNKQILKPLPDYKQLKQDSKDLVLKVQSFYTGDYYVKEDTNFPVNKQTEMETKPLLPLTDNNSQNALRRKIYLNSLNKTMQNLLESLELEMISISSDIQALVKTFKLNAKNVTFRPLVWNYIAIVLLKILSLKNGNLRDILLTEKAQSYLESQLDSLPNKTKFLDEIISEIEDVDVFMENYITCQEV